jgi:hypothetical protein
LIQATDTTSNRHDELEINEDFPGEILYENPILANSLENEEELAILHTEEEMQNTYKENIKRTS